MSNEQKTVVFIEKLYASSYAEPEVNTSTLGVVVSTRPNPTGSPFPLLDILTMDVNNIPVVVEGLGSPDDPEAFYLEWVT